MNHSHFSRKHFLVALLGLVFTLGACGSKSPAPYIKKADALLAQNKPEEALIVYQNAIHQIPDEPVLYLNQAAILRDMKKYPLATRDYQVVKNLSPDSYWPYVGLARVYLLQKKFSDAKSILKDGTKKALEKDSGILLYYLGRTYFEEGDGDKAIEYFDKALDAKYAKMNDIYYFRGLAFETLLKNNSRAKLDYQSYLMYPDGEKATEVKERLERLDQSGYEF